MSRARKFKIEKVHIIDTYNVLGEVVSEHDEYFIYYRSFGLKKYLHVSFHLKDGIYRIPWPGPHNGAKVDTCCLDWMRPEKGFAESDAKLIIRDIYERPDQYVIK